MRYVTSFETSGLKRGIRESVVKVLKARFKRVPGSLKNTIQAIDEESLLSKLLVKAALAESLEAFEKIAERIRQTAPEKTFRGSFDSLTG